MKLKFKLIKNLGKVENIEYFKNQFNESFKKLNDWEYLITLEKYKKERSKYQNNYYWFILSEFSKEIWINAELLHEECKYKFLRTIFIWTKWQEIFKILSTKNLNTYEFETYLESIRKWALEEYNLILPLPNESIDNLTNF